MRNTVICAWSLTCDVIKYYIILLSTVHATPVDTCCGIAEEDAKELRMNIFQKNRLRDLTVLRIVCGGRPAMDTDKTRQDIAVEVRGVD